MTQMGISCQMWAYIASDARKAEADTKCYHIPATERGICTVSWRNCRNFTLRCDRNVPLAAWWIFTRSSACLALQKQFGLNWRAIFYFYFLCKCKMPWFSAEVKFLFVLQLQRPCLIFLWEVCFCFYLTHENVFKEKSLEKKHLKHLEKLCCKDF